MTKEIRLGLKENRKQFILLVIINAFVGGMVGLERSMLPLIAEKEYHIALKTAIFSFIIVFGIVKAITNYFAGALADKVGRKNLLTIGWLFAIPVPFILMSAQNWNWVIVANIFLGINQGLAWSSTVIMKIDLVGEKERGFAMGLNEFAGYISVGLVAFLTGWVAAEFGLRLYPFYIGIFLSLAGFFASWLLVKDTRHHVAKETTTSSIPKLKNVFWDTTLFNRNLGAVTQAGLANNLNDGMMWGLLPIILATKHFGVLEIGIVTAVYPAVWGIGQLITGSMSDFFCKKSLLFWGMFLQGIALLFLIFASTFTHFIVLSVILGWGTAMVYPAFLAAVAENTNPQDRAKSLGTFRLWRDLGYAFGAILTGIIIDILGTNEAIITIGILTIFSSLFIKFRMVCNTSSIKLPEWIFSKLFSRKIN